MLGLHSSTVLLLALGDPRGDAEVGVTLAQRVGELPSGLPDGSSVLAYDTELSPLLGLEVSDDRWMARLVYEARLLFRIQFPDGGPADPLSVGDRPFLILHTGRAEANHQIAPRWTWAGVLSGLIGEQDFALFAQEGVAAPTTPGGPGAGTAARIDSAVIETTSFGVDTSLTGPLIGHDDFRLSALAQVTLPSPIPTGMAGPVMDETATGSGGDVLCFGDPVGNRLDESGAAGFALAESCQLGVALATISPLSPRDRLELQVGYDAIDLDPGPFIHAVSESVLWRRVFSRSVEGTFRAGGILALYPDPFEGQDSASPLPIADVGLIWQIVHLRLFRLGLTLNAGTDGFIEPVTSRYLLRGTATAALLATIRDDITAALRVSGFLLGLDLECPPRLNPDGRPAPSDVCPEDLPPEQRDAARLAETPDMSSFSSDASLDWRIDQHLAFFSTARFAFRAPHISRWGAEPVEPPMGVAPAPALPQREVSVQVGLRFRYGTRPPDPAATTTATP